MSASRLISESSEWTFPMLERYNEVIGQIAGSVALYLVNGWNNSIDNNAGKTFGANISRGSAGRVMVVSSKRCVWVISEFPCSMTPWLRRAGPDRNSGRLPK